MNGDSGRFRDERRKHNSRRCCSDFILNSERTGLSAAAKACEESSLAVSVSFNGSRFVDSKAVSCREGVSGWAVDDSVELEEDEFESCCCCEASEDWLLPLASLKTWLVATSVDSSTLCLFLGNSMSSI